MSITIEDLADILGVELVIRRYPNQKNRYAANFKGAEVKEYREHPGLCSLTGNGYSPQSAINDYARKISGKWLVFDAGGGDNRREFGVPELRISDFARSAPIRQR